MDRLMTLRKNAINRFVVWDCELGTEVRAAFPDRFRVEDADRVAGTNSTRGNMRLLYDYTFTIIGGYPSISIPAAGSDVEAVQRLRNLGYGANCVLGMKKSAGRVWVDRDRA